MTAEKYKVSLQSHIQSLNNGRQLIPGEFIDLNEEEVQGHRDLIDSGDLMKVEEPKPLTKTELLERAKAHSIKGYTTMDEDQLRQAVADAENPNKQKEGDS
jgi:hypothetical protein